MGPECQVAMASDPWAVRLCIVGFSGDAIKFIRDQTVSSDLT